MRNRFQLAIIDTTDAYYFADVFDGDRYETYWVEDELNVVKMLADSYFKIKNFMWTSLKEMNDVDGGYDVRVYDENYKCLYKAHKKYEKKWFR